MSDNSFWNQDWMETQQKYWQQLTDMSLKAMGGQADAAPWSNAWTHSPWESAMDQWWQALSPAAPAMGRDFMDKMIDQGKKFFRMADGFTGNFGPGQTGADMTGAMEKAFADLQKAFSGGMQGGDDALHKMMAFWEMPFDNWQRMVSSLSLTPGDALRNMPHDQVKDNLNRFLSAPGLGYSREEQGQYQALVRANMEYQKALQEYMQFFSNLGMQSVERMRQKLTAMQEKEQVIDSARGLYDTWVAACEEVYAEQVMTPEYATIHGHLVNALMALKHRLSVLVDETLGALNMPTRSELRTLQDRLQETRRENKALRHDLEMLKDQVAALGGGATAAAVAASPAPRAPVRRKTAKKKVTATKKVAAKPSDAS
jgi:class III poly(R)-hydroxyalkanoic acid synthase PhaE subunit